LRLLFFLSMAAGKKQFKLKMVEEGPPPPDAVIRLGKRKIRQKNPIPRLEVQPEFARPSVRLDPPVIETGEIRTHQPGIEAIIENPWSTFVNPEQEWGEESSESNGIPIPWGWFVLVGLLLTSAVVWSLIGVKNAQSQARRIEDATESLLGNRQREAVDASRLVDRIETVTRSFFAASQVDDMIPLVRQPERVLPLMKKFYQDKPLLGNPVVNMIQFQPLTVDNRADFWLVSVLLKNGTKQDFLLEVEKSGAPRIDWETLVCDQPMPWNQFVQERPTGVSLDFRVYIENDNFFSHDFADSNRWDCFRLTTLNGEEALFGYTPSGGDLSQQLRRYIEQNGGNRVTMIVRLMVPEGTQSRRGVLIEKLIAPRWIYLDPPEP
jgi:hypothetical protein